MDDNMNKKEAIKELIEELTSRQAAIVEAYLQALTGTAAGSTSRPA